MSNITSGQDVIRAVVNDIEVSMKQQGYVVAYTEEELQKMADLVQAEIEKAFELGREDAMSKIIQCEDCKYHKTYTLYGQKQCFCNRRGLQSMEFDDYCSRAERREE